MPEITSGILVEGAADPAVTSYAATENAWQLFLSPGDADGALLEGAGVVARSWVADSVVNGQRIRFAYSDVVEFELQATLLPDGTISGTVTVGFPPESQKLVPIEGDASAAPFPDIEGEFNGTWSEDGRTLTGRIIAGWIDSTLEAVQTGVQPAPRPEPRAEEFVGAGPYGLEQGLLRAAFSFCDEELERQDCIARCELLVDPESWEQDPGRFAERFVQAAFWLNEAMVQRKPLTPFASVSVQQVISRLASDVIENPDSVTYLGALVRFFNFNLWIHGIER